MIGLLLALFMATAATARTNETGAAFAGSKVLNRQFRDYVILFPVPDGQQWSAAWNDKGQMAVFENPTNRVVITTQYLKFPKDEAFQRASGDRDAYLDVALRKYCAVQLQRSGNPAVRNQEIKIEGRTLGTGHFRYCPILGHDKRGPRRGYFYILMREVDGQPRFNGETIIFTIGYPENLPAEDQQRALKVFDAVLQNVFFP